MYNFNRGTYGTNYHPSEKQTKAQALIEFLKAMDFVEAVTSGFTIPKPKTQVDEDDFFALKGLWVGRNISLESIRQKAWPSNS